MTLDDLERQNRRFYGFFCDIGLRHKSISFTRRRHRRQRHTRLWPMCIMVPMGRVQVICDFRNYNYWTGNAIGFHASRELCSNFLSDITELYFALTNYFSHTLLPRGVDPLLALLEGILVDDSATNDKFFTRESSYCFQRILAIAILSVCHTGGSDKNGPS